jgi:cell wall assembly regulator SMI1
MSSKLLLQSLNRLKEWYEQHQPVVVDGFNEGISMQEIQKIETEIEVQFPESLKTLLENHNGTDAFVLFDGHEVCRLLSANEIKAEYKTQQITIDSQEELAQELKLPFHPNRLPVLLYLSGDFSYLHPDTGELVYISQEGDSAHTFYDLSEFIGQMADRLEKGRYQLDEYGSIRMMEVNELWVNIRKFLNGHLAHRGELFCPKISHNEQKKLLQTIREIHPNFNDLAYNDLPESLRLTLSAHNGQNSDFKLFFYEDKSYYLLSVEEMIRELKSQKGNGKLLLPILSNGRDMVCMDLLNEELYVNKTDYMGIDWTDFLLSYWDHLQNRRFGVSDESLFAKNNF